MADIDVEEVLKVCDQLEITADPVPVKRHEPQDLPSKYTPKDVIQGAQPRFATPEEKLLARFHFLKSTGASISEIADEIGVNIYELKLFIQENRVLSRKVRDKWKVMMREEFEDDVAYSYMIIGEESRNAIRALSAIANDPEASAKDRIEAASKIMRVLHMDVDGKISAAKNTPAQSPISINFPASAADALKTAGFQDRPDPIPIPPRPREDRALSAGLESDILDLGEYEVSE